MIYDCFPFFQELDLLEIRLNVLAEAVDVFVIVESNYTFSGIPKDYVLEEHLDRYSQFPILYFRHDQIHLRDEQNPWIREFDHRRALKTFLPPNMLAADDLIIMGDLDEVPDPADIDGRTQARFHERCYYFYLNCRSWPHRYGSVMYPASFMADQDYEEIRSDGPGPILEGSGWHWSSCGRDEDVLAKMDAFSHYREFDREETMRRRATGMDILGHGVAVEPIDETFPQYLRENWQERYSHLVQPWA